MDLTIARRNLTLIDEVERNIREFAPPAVRNVPLPDYVEHRDGIGEIGKLSAEAVVREYEETVKAIEAMAAELSERARQCEQLVKDTLAVRDEVTEIAAIYREGAKRIFLHVEDCSLMTAEVRKACEALRSKIALPVQEKTT